MSAKRSAELVFKESADIGKLRYILENWDSLPLREESKRGDDNWIPTAIITDYIRMSKGNKVIVKYSQSKNNVGRFFAFKGRSLQGLPREVRHTIARDYYYDIDIVNCHPTILLQYCQKNGIECHCLKDYVENRDERVQKAMEYTGLSKAEVKTGVLALTNGGFGTFTKDIMERVPTWIKNYKINMDIIHNAIAEREVEFAKIGSKTAKEKEKAGKYSNPKGSTVNLLLCDIENRLLMAMIEYMKSAKLSIEDCVLVFDGVMIAKSVVNRENMDSLLRNMEAFVKDITGYTIHLIEKPMDEILPIPEDYTLTNQEIIIEDDENEASDKFYELVKDDIRKCDNIIFVRRNGIWIDDQREVTSYLIDKCLRANFIKVDDHGNKKTYSSKLSGAKNIVEAMMTRIPSQPDFIKAMKKSSHNKIVWLDGSYDFNTKTFTRGFAGVDSVIQISRPFPERNEAVIQEVYDRVVYPVWGRSTDGSVSEQGRVYLQFIARAISGNYADKKFGTMGGERDSGKGCLATICMSAFERYVGTINSESLLVQRVGGGDEAKKLSWTMAMEHTRLAITNEIKLDEANGLKLDGNMIKKIASGGDVIQARKNHKDERDFQIGATLLMCCNDLPKITPADAYQKMVPFMCPHKFEEDLTAERKAKLPFLQKADNNIKEFCERKEVGDAFFHIIADHYQTSPVKLTEKMREYLREFNTEDETDIVLSNFHITLNDEDRVSSNEVQDFLKTRRLNMTLAKFKLMMENRRVTYKVCKINGKSTRAYVGVKFVGEESENEDN